MKSVIARENRESETAAVHTIVVAFLGVSRGSSFLYEKPPKVMTGLAAEF